MAPPSGGNQLDLSQGPVPQRIPGPAHKKEKPQPQAGGSEGPGIQESGIKGRKRLEPGRRRDMLLPQGREPVVSRHEQVVSADMVLLQKRGPVGRHPPGIRCPLHLHSVVQRPPGGQGPKMHRLVTQLPQGPGERGPRLGTPTTLPVPVVEGDPSH